MDQNNEQNNADALEKPTQTNSLDTLGMDEDIHYAAGEQPLDQQPKKRFSFNAKQLWRKMNVYLLIFVLLCVVTTIVFIVAYINSQKDPAVPVTALQDLSSKDLQEIASGNSNIGDPRYLLSIQSDAVFAGNALVKGDLNIAGNIQLGQSLSVPNMTVSGTTNLSTVQINNLSVAGTTALQGRISIQDELSVGRSLNVGGSLVAAQVSTGALSLNGSLSLNNHITAGGPAVKRSQGGAVGSGGSSSISGSDLAGTINVNTGSGTAAGCFATITFSQRYSTTPRVIVSPIGSGAGETNYYVDRSNSGFSVCAATPAPTGRSFAFDYFVVG